LKSIVLAAVLIAASATAAAVSPAAAPTAEAGGQTVCDGFYGCGKTYQNNWWQSCFWYDYRGGTGAPCWRGVWSETTSLPSSPPQYVYVYERAFVQSFTCQGGGVGGFCDDWYEPFAPDPYEVYSMSPAQTNGIHFFCGEFSCTRKLNVIGYANHYNLTYSYNYYWYTEAMEWR
jgi:hypothetical protein